MKIKFIRFHGSVEIWKESYQSVTDHYNSRQLIVFHAMNLLRYHFGRILQSNRVMYFCVNNVVFMSALRCKYVRAAICRLMTIGYFNVAKNRITQIVHVFRRHYIRHHVIASRPVSHQQMLLGQRQSRGFSVLSHVLANRCCIASNRLLSYRAILYLTHDQIPSKSLTDSIRE